jgi:hypothetical protein
MYLPSAPMGPRSVAAGGAARPLGGPTRNPWKAKHSEIVYSSSSFRPDGAKGTPELTKKLSVWQGDHDRTASRAATSAAPSGAGVSVTHSFHGLRSARLQRAELHPRLHSAAPSGRVCIRVGAEHPPYILWTLDFELWTLFSGLKRKNGHEAAIGTRFAHILPSLPIFPILRYYNIYRAVAIRCPKTSVFDTDSIRTGPQKNQKRSKSASFALPILPKSGLTGLGASARAVSSSKTRSKACAHAVFSEIRFFVSI